MRLAELAAAACVAATPTTPATLPGYIFLPFRGGVSFAVAVDTTLVAAVNEHEARIVDMRGDLVTMVDSYASRPDAAGGCAEGREVWVRLLDMATRTERQATLAQSCRRGITSADPLVTWDADGSGYTVNLTNAAPVRVAVPDRGLPAPAR